MMNICTKYGFDIFIISGSYGGHRRHTTYDGQRHGYMYKLPTGELKRTLNMELWTFNTEHIQEGETNSRIDIRRSDRIVIIIIITVKPFIFASFAFALLTRIYRVANFS